MATRSSIDIPCYDSDPATVEDFIADIEVYFTAIGLSAETHAKQCAATLLCQAGKKMRKQVQISTPLLPKGNNENDYQHVKRIILTKELPKKNNTHESYIFRKIIQREGESFQSFVLRLETQISRCEYTDRDRQLQDQIVIGCSSENLRKVALREDPNLQKLLELGKTEEYALSSAKTISSDQTEQAFRTSSNNKPQNPSRSSQRSKEKNCYNCGFEFPHATRECPAIGKTCDGCHKIGHFPFSSLWTCSKQVVI